MKSAWEGPDNRKSAPQLAKELGGQLTVAAARLVWKTARSTAFTAAFAAFAFAFVVALPFCVHYGDVNYY